MDELAESLANSFSVTTDVNSTATPHPRFADYKKKSTGPDQDKRRQLILDQQKDRRFDAANHARRLVDDAWDDCKDFDNNEGEDMEVTENKVKKDYKPGRYYRNQIMLSEWMVDVPEDFEDEWLMVVCPWGKRCLVVSSYGYTTAYCRNGRRVSTFPSFLPGGNRKDYKDGNKGNAILDCIYHEVEKTFYVLDIMNWKDHPVYDSETDFRVFWMLSKMQELPQLGEVDKYNPYKFIPLTYHPCKKETLKEVFDNTQEQFDGCLFYHKRAHYTFGTSPLVVWLKPYMITEMLGIEVPEGMMLQKPANYSTYAVHIQEVKERKEKIAAEREKKRGRRKLKQGLKRSKEYKMDMMESQWLTTIPDDFETDWVTVVCPVGQRCQVLAIDGETKCFSRKGFKLPGYFLSVLPGGNGNEYGFGPTVVTLLDCIYHYKKRTYFVLDCMLWASEDLKEKPYEERLKFLKNEFDRKPELKYVTDRNMYKIVPLYQYTASLTGIDEAIRQSTFEIDGLLFFKNDGTYVSGRTDNALWTKLYILPDLFEDISIPKKYMEEKPEQYKDFEHFVEKVKIGRYKDDAKKLKNKAKFVPEVDLELPPQPEEEKKKTKKKKKPAQYCYYGPQEGFRGRGLNRGRGGSAGRGRGKEEPAVEDQGENQGEKATGGGGSYSDFVASAGGDAINPQVKRTAYGRGIATGNTYYGDYQDLYYPPTGYVQKPGGRRLTGKQSPYDAFGMSELDSALPYYDYNAGRKQGGRRGGYKLF